MRLLADRRRISNAGKGMASKMSSYKHGTDCHKNWLGMTGTFLSFDWRIKCVSAGDGFCITAAILLNCVPVAERSQISHTQLVCSSAAITLPSSMGARPLGRRYAEYPITIGKFGQISMLFLTGVLYVQKTRRLRQSGDANVICRHLWHTYTKVCHFHNTKEGQ